MRILCKFLRYADFLLILRGFLENTYFFSDFTLISYEFFRLRVKDFFSVWEVKWTNSQKPAPYHIFELFACKTNLKKNHSVILVQKVLFKHINILLHKVQACCIQKQDMFFHQIQSAHIQLNSKASDIYHIGSKTFFWYHN